MSGTPCLAVPNTRTEAEVRAAMDMRERAADLVDRLGDEEFARRAKTGNIGIATLTQRHYIACSTAIRMMTLVVGDPESLTELAGKASRS